MPYAGVTAILATIITYFIVAK